MMYNTSTVVAYLNRHSVPWSNRLLALKKKILLWTMAHRVRILANHISSHLNVMAIQLSPKGQVIETEWSLHPKVVQGMWNPRWTCSTAGEITSYQYMWLLSQIP